MNWKLRAAAFGLGVLTALPLIAHDIPENRAAMTGVWRGGIGRPDISNITAEGQAVMDAYDQSEDQIMRCLLDWGRINTVEIFPMELIVDEHQVTILYEYNHSVRRVFLDQTEFPDAFPPSLVGYSIGHWEGDTLVVETRKLLPGWINMQGVTPYSAEAVMTETFRIDPENPDRLIVQRTVDDPVYYDGPISWTSQYRPSESPIFPYDCTVGSFGSSLGP